MRHYGFNFLWMFIWQPGVAAPPPDERALDFLAQYGFNFVRVPTDYRFWTSDFDYFHPDDRVWEKIDAYLDACRARGIHLCLNLHRAPGYCINANHLEKHNLWLDETAQDAFVFQWESFAKRYKGIPNEILSFDLVNEPPNIGQYGMTRENHAALVRRTASAIRAVDPGRRIVIDGLGGGNLAMPELADLDVIQSGRGYQPMAVSHYQAGWWDGHQAVTEVPYYPGLRWNGFTWNKDTLHEYYRPWRELEAQGVQVHIGEFGCYNQTPNDVALAWFSDLLGLWKEYGWGYSLWNFEGSFGIIGHDRPGVKYENIGGYQVDRPLMQLLLDHRVME
jgi:aryl-phospho-beta-D-glucosidase BglC (GH1 family)